MGAQANLVGAIFPTGIGSVLALLGLKGPILIKNWINSNYGSDVGNGCYKYAIGNEIVVCVVDNSILKIVLQQITIKCTHYVVVWIYWLSQRLVEMWRAEIKLGDTIMRCGQGKGFQVCTFCYDLVAQCCWCSIVPKIIYNNQEGIDQIGIIAKYGIIGIIGKDMGANLTRSDDTILLQEAGLQT